MKRNGHRNGKAHALAKPAADPIAPRANKVAAPDRGVAAGPVEWIVTTTHVVTDGTTTISSLRQEMVRAQTWFFARQEGARLLGV
jgi:hypothetical protein